LKVLGLMSGTSLDGLDLCLVDFVPEQEQHFKIIAANTYPYSAEWQKKLSFKNLSASELHKMDQEYSLLLAKMVLQFCKDQDLKPSEIDLLASHGHTWFHKPQEGISLQIGNRPSLAIETGIPLVCDFRLQDVALGGQGAPLVPIGDRDLFSNYEACLNLGGFANISFDKDGRRLAFDIGPCNLPINHYCQQLGLEYDDQGTIAAAHAHHDELFSQLNSLDYYQLKAPKSLGREWLEDVVFPIIEQFDISPEQKIATLNRHVAYQIAQSLKAHSLKKVLISGGGALNQTLIDSIGIWGEFEIEIAESQILHYKEALIFAYLGYLHQRGKVNVLASVTGAQRDHRSGILYPA